MEHPNRIKIILADDHEVFLKGLAAEFAGNKDYDIVDTCRNGDQLVRSVAIHKPMIVLTDLKMPVLSGIEAIERIRAVQPEVLFVVLTSFDNDYLILDALEAGAVSYVNKAMSISEIFEAIASTLQNIPYYCKSTSLKLARIIANSRFGNEKKTDELFSKLEKAIIALYCEDNLVKEIGETLHMSPRTVERYKREIMEKMGVKTTGGLVVYAIRHGLYIPGEEKPPAD